VDKRWYGVGWDVCLPGFFDLQAVPETEWGQFVQRLMWMSRFPTTRAHPWFKNALAHLRSFQTSESWFRFPSNNLPEKSAGYWVNASYSALEPGRRTAGRLEIESTLRIMELLEGV
jgi:hypothetical protein